VCVCVCVCVCHVYIYIRGQWSLAIGERGVREAKVARGVRGARSGESHVQGLGIRA
jgi:hypothetical protein